MKPWKVGLFALAVGVVSAAITDAKQERDSAYPQTRMWNIADTSVYVVDTAGVCLYIWNSYEKGGIAAVPKTQLPKGAGCQ